MTPTMPDSQTDGQELRGSSPTDITAARISGPSGLWKVGVSTDRGIVRQQNEDAWLAYQLALNDNEHPVEAMALFIVADGVGGSRAGATASKLAVRVAAHEILGRLVKQVLHTSDAAPAIDPVNEILVDALESAHWRLRRDVRESASTLTLALFLGLSLYVAHVGDTRAYAEAASGLRCLTRDHSMAERLASIGQLDSVAAQLQRHRLYQALGYGSSLHPDLNSLRAGDYNYFLLCTDGVWGQVSDTEMAASIRAASSAQEASDQLIERARLAGGADNATALVIAQAWPPVVV
jgi:serine/threonine protein phosphatase PrpC